MCIYLLLKYDVVSLVLSIYYPCVLAGDLVGIFSAPLKQIAALKSEYSHDDGNKWKWIDLLPPDPKVLFIFIDHFPLSLNYLIL